MRYNNPIYFVKQGKKEYDPDTGEWIQGEVVKVKRFANVTHMSAERQQAIFGDVKANRFILRLQRPYKAAYDFIELDGKRCTVDTERCPSDKQSLVVIENVGN